VAALIAGQLWSAPKTYVARKAARQPGELVERLPGGKLSLYGGRFQLEVAQSPCLQESHARIWIFTVSVIMLIICVRSSGKPKPDKISIEHQETKR